MAMIIIAGCKPTIKESPAPLIDMKVFFKNGDKNIYPIMINGLNFMTSSSLFTIMFKPECIGTR